VSKEVGRGILEKKLKKFVFAKKEEGRMKNRELTGGRKMSRDLKKNQKGRCQAIRRRSKEAKQEKKKMKDFLKKMRIAGAETKI